MYLSANRFNFESLDFRYCRYQKFKYCNFRRAVEADRKAGATRACAGVALHAAMAPITPAMRARRVGVMKESSDQREANLAGVRMAAEIQMNTGSGGGAIESRGVCEQHLKTAGRDGIERRGKIVAAVIVGIVNSREPNSFTFSVDWRRFVDEHAYTHLFETEGNLRSVVIAENGVNALLCANTGENTPQARIHTLAGAIIAKAVIAGEDA